MSILTVEDALGWSATVFDRNFVTSATEFQVQINATTRIVIRGQFGDVNAPPYTGTYDAPQVGTIASFEIWQTSNATRGAAIQGQIVVTGPLDRLETLFQDMIMPADAVRSSIPRNIVVPTVPGPVHEGGSTYFDIQQTDGTFLRFVGHDLAYDAAGFPLTTQGSIDGVIELDSAKHDFGTGVHNFNSAGLGIISVTPLAVYMALYDTVLINAFYSGMFDNAGLSAEFTGNLGRLNFPFAGFFGSGVITGDARANVLDSYFGADTMAGGGGGDVLNGRGGDDVLGGGAGGDLLLGGTGSDRIAGGEGNDRLFGQLGADVLTGNAGADQFVFRVARDSGVVTVTRDTITDFSRAEHDRINLSALDPIPGGRDQDLTLDTGGGFTRGEVRIVSAPGGRMVEINLDGDAAAELQILVQNVTQLGAVDFIL